MTEVKTCKRGHPQTPENVYVNPYDGGHRCRECKRELGAESDPRGGTK